VRQLRSSPQQPGYARLRDQGLPVASGESGQGEEEEGMVMGAKDDKLEQVKKGDIPKWVKAVAAKDAAAKGGRAKGNGWGGKKR
jgi:hypothetical protein